VTTFYVLLLLVALLAGWYLIPFGLRKISFARLGRYCREQKAIVLSYDDGPSSDLTPRLLDLLEEKETKATFFLLGRNVEKRQEIIPRLVTTGHEIGSHTFDHTNAWKVWPWRAANDLAHGLRNLEAFCVQTDMFRPPYGKSTPAMLADCWRRKLRLGWWTIDSRDTWDRRPISDVTDEIEARGGGVVLMHDLDISQAPDDGQSHADYVLELTRNIIELATIKGYKVQRLGDVYAEAV
jgi:peptidoglycan/xylan/chitin deacetylase (PgdA/CDA1 family)